MLFWLLVLFFGAGCSKDEPRSGDNRLLSFAFLENDNPGLAFSCLGQIDDASGQIAVAVPFGTPLTSLKASVTLPPFATVDPIPYVPNNYSSPLRFTVTAQNGTTRDYRVTVTVLPNLRVIQQLTFSKSKNPYLDRDYSVLINQDQQTGSLSLPPGMPIDRAIPTITVPQGSSVSPSSGSTVNFNAPVSFVVTDSSGLSQTYVVTVTSAAETPTLASLSIEGAVCPLNVSDTTYFYALREGATTFTLDGEGRSISAFRIEGRQITRGVATPLSFFRPGKRLKVTPLNRLGEAGKAVNLVLTSLPVVSVEVAGTIVNEPKIECFVALIDPSAKTNRAEHYFPRHRAGIEIRGGMAQGAAKKSYSLEFRMPHSDEEVLQGTELFGLRDDGDWILDAMYVDKARMRNRLSTDVWNAISTVPYASVEPKARNGTRGRFVELLINGSYQGLYCMTERIDRKQLDIHPEEGMMYKGTGWSTATEFISGEASFNNNSDSWNGWELEFQGTRHLFSAPTVKWEPLRDLIRFTVNATDEEFVAQLSNRFHLINLADYLLFMNTVGADDNTGKNSFFSFYSSNYPQFFITPWDLDGSWGRKWSGSKIDLREDDFIGITGPMRVDSRYCRPNAFFQRVMALNPGNFRQILQQRWALHRSGEFTATRFAERLTTYGTLFTESGAWDREKQRWASSLSGIDLDTELDFMLTWITNRLQQMDNLIVL